MNWEDRMAQLQKDAQENECRELIEVPSGHDYQIRQYIEKYPQFLWKYSEGVTIPGYVLNIAEQLNSEYGNVENIPVLLIR